ncbi:hypothetical protein FDP41_002679 [Naegleria fowleri]|uniref:Uncharacterized protein n=1 Tax=Naegleria fowleri TaxID=5763 RepID=A0A6A5BV68_NAEFO|nr:uncharacterized protein FDP41_002679 [Naegleria fowleri]KAF0978164.1 hypothetical protein FDP41_002679 [Naegleria fowleri]CAG4712197.1 unnamed protein product [Naegleria fowleri]
MVNLKLFIKLKPINKTQRVQKMEDIQNHCETLNNLSLNAFQQLVQKKLNHSSFEKMNIKVRVGDKFRSIHNEKKWKEWIPKLEMPTNCTDLIEFKVVVVLVDHMVPSMENVTSSQKVEQVIETKEEKNDTPLPSSTEKEMTPLVPTSLGNELAANQKSQQVNDLKRLKDEIADIKNVLKLKKQEFKNLKIEIKQRKQLSVASDLVCVVPKEATLLPNETKCTSKTEMKHWKEERKHEKLMTKIERENFKKLKKELQKADVKERFKPSSNQTRPCKTILTQQHH